MCSAGAHGRMTFEADSVDENLTVSLVLLIMDHGGTFEVSVKFIITMMNLAEGRCSLKNLHVLHKSTHTNLEMIILYICLHHR